MAPARFALSAMKEQIAVLEAILSSTTLVANPVPMRKRAPGPKRPQLLMGNLGQMRSNPFQLLLTAQREQGDIARLRLGPYTVHSVTHPDLIQYVLQDNNKNYIRGKMYEQFKCFMGEGLLTNDGAAWVNHRRMAQPLFNRRSVDTMVSTMTLLSAAMIDEWERLARNREVFDLVPEMMHLSLGILSRVMFSTDISDEAKQLASAVRFSLTAMIFSGSMSQLLPSWLPLPYNLRVKRDRRSLHDVMDRLIADHQGEGRPDDLVSLLIEGRNQESGKQLSHIEVRDELMTIFLAGHETTGTGLSWMFYALSKHPEVRRNLEDEVDAVLGGRAPVLEDLPRMPYSRMIVDEALRMYPPIWLYPRDAVADDEIGGYHVPAGSSVFLTPYVTHRHPAFWDNPEAFDPERFNPAREANRPRYAYFPFGGGQRQCIGNHMALLQLQIVLVMVAQRFRMQVVSGHPIEQGFLVSLRPVNGILMTLKARETAPRTVSQMSATVVEKPVASCPFHH
jgi:cytochrome P450